MGMQRYFTETIGSKPSMVYNSEWPRAVKGDYRADRGASSMIQRLYEAPNGGNRLLPSAYTSLTKSWVRSNWIEVHPSKMNNGHLDNTLKLLIESHGNLIARSTSVLGKVHAHFANCPEVQAKLEEACILMQQTEVNNVYPVFDALAEEFDSRLYSKLGKLPFEKTLDHWDDLK